MRIADIDLDKEVLVVAEIGNNHEGEYELAEDMIRLAAKAGAGAVKFQTIVPEKLVSPANTERVRQLERFRLTRREFRRLKGVADRENLVFLSTPFDLESARFLNSLVPAFKIASGDNNFYPLLAEVAATGKPIMLSTGLADLAQIARSKRFIEREWRSRKIRQELALLHCVCSYPVPPDEVNLSAIATLRKELDRTVGYSDHSLGIEAAVGSVFFGARIVEKHFTLDKNHSDFYDHKISADPGEFARMVQRIRAAVQMLGDGKKRIASSECANLEKARRSIVAARALPEGTVLSWKDLSWVRPGGGLAPGRENDILGKRLLRPVRKGEMITRESLDI
ncbi:MAG: N-acetylneuraminate synthase family protein [Planctomycetota bacterium]|nr:N-acetylneuraminate synthase family protein [Planctomycetota bacterium]